MRDHCNEQELSAHKILDFAAAGGDVSSETITRALWVLGDAVGLVRFNGDDIDMKLLHINEPRCAGRDTKLNPTICPGRTTCARHRQMEIDRQMGLDALSGIKVMNLPYIPGKECTFREKV